MRIGDLRECGGAQNNREHSTDVADHVKTAARHGSLPRFAGAPLIFYNRVGPLARHKVVIEMNGRATISDTVLTQNVDRLAVPSMRLSCCGGTRLRSDCSI